MLRLFPYYFLLHRFCCRRNRWICGVSFFFAALKFSMNYKVYYWMAWCSEMVHVGFAGRCSLCIPIHHGHTHILCADRMRPAVHKNGPGMCVWSCWLIALNWMKTGDYDVICYFSSFSSVFFFLHFNSVCRCLSHLSLSLFVSFIIHSFIYHC